MKIAKKALHALPSSMRVKKRYVLAEFLTSQKFSQQDLNSALNAVALSLYGSSFTAQLSLQLIAVDYEKNRAIVKCAREQLDRVKAIILFLKQIGGAVVTPKIVKVSGSLKRLKEVK